MGAEMVLIECAIRYTQRMWKIGGLALVAALTLTGCATTQAAPASTNRAVVQPASVQDSAKVQDFVKSVQQSRSGYSTIPAQGIAAMAPDLCEHYAGGFTTDDLRKADGERLAVAGEIALKTVCR